MDGENGAPGGSAPQAGSTPPPQAGNQAGGQEPPASTGQAPAADPPETGSETAEQRMARLERELKDTRNEAAANRRKAQALEAAQAEAQRAGMTELEREQARAVAAEERAKQLEASLQAQAVETATVSVATRLGFRNPELASRLIDRGELEFDSEGKPKNVEPLLQSLAKTDPYLLKSAGGDYGGGNRGATPEGKPGMNELMRAALGK